MSEVRVDYTHSGPRCSDLTQCHMCRARGGKGGVAKVHKGYPLCQHHLKEQLKRERRGR